MQCDIIIPMHNSAAVLPHVLPSLLTQTLPAGWGARVLISDDGSTDDSVAVAQRLVASSQWDCLVLNNPHRGRAATRNAALAQATGTVLFFSQADLILAPGALAAHLAWHEQHPADNQAALGAIQWDPRLKPTPLMEWLVHGGPQNDFDALLGQEVISPRDYFYGANLSLKRRFLGEERFAEIFRDYGFEDYELGLRLAQQGLQLTFLETAQAWHRHRYALADVARRQRAVGRELLHLAQLHPAEELPRNDLLASRWKYRLATYGGLVALLRGIVACWPGLSWPWAFKVLTMAWFWSGYQSVVNKAKK